MGTGYHIPSDADPNVRSCAGSRPSGIGTESAKICLNCLADSKDREFLVKEITRRTGLPTRRTFESDDRFKDVVLPPLRQAPKPQAKPTVNHLRNARVVEDEKARKARNRRVDEQAKKSQILAERYRRHQTNGLHKSYLLDLSRPGRIKAAAARLYADGQTLGGHLSDGQIAEIAFRTGLGIDTLEHSVSSSVKTAEIHEWPTTALLHFVEILKPMRFADLEYLVSQVTEIRDQLLQLDRRKPAVPEARGKRGYSDFGWTTDDSGRAK